VPDIGLGEVLLMAVLALLIFGPDRLPKVAADAGRLLRQVRGMASTARKDLIDAAGLQEDGEVRSVVHQLDPRRALREESPSVARTAPNPAARGSSGNGPSVGSTRSGAAESAAPATDAGSIEDWT
jgi:sec-independent protein translocase protein TatB